MGMYEGLLQRVVRFSRGKWVGFHSCVIWYVRVALKKWRYFNVIFSFQKYPSTVILSVKFTPFLTRHW
jgi:hypothetical protein